MLRRKQEVLAGLAKLENMEELYEVAGEYDIMSLVSASCIEELRETLQNKILKIKGVNCLIANIILKPHKACAKLQKNIAQVTL